MKRTAFTLVELLISIALVLLLILGINQVFSMTARAVGVGSAMGIITRDNRAAQSVIYNDFRGFASDGPLLLIRSQSKVAYLDKLDELADTDTDINTADLDGNGSETDAGEDVNNFPWLINRRMHRLDTLSFFGRDLYRRQTGKNNAEFVTSMSATDGWLWYGHLSMPDNGFATYFWPGMGTAATNPNNFYARQWNLGRMVFLLRNPTNRASPDDEGYIASGANLEPLAYGSPSEPAGYTIEQSRYDVASTSPDDYKVALDAAAGNWWESFGYRFQANPFPLKPIDSTDMAFVAPIFVSHCKDFIVEFAGDFYEQTASEPQGVADYVIDANNTQSTRWYGETRDSNGDGVADVTRVEDATGMGTRRVESTDFEVTGTDGAYYAVLRPGNRMPQMIRITLSMLDERGRIEGAQVYEYVITLR